MDDFGIKYYSKDDANHLLQALKAKYNVTEDWTGTNYCGFTFNWNYNEGFVDISMPGYVQAALQRLNHQFTKPQYSPHDHAPVQYGRTGPQYAKTPDTSQPLSKKDTLYIMSTVGSFLYYGRAYSSSFE